MKVHIYSESGHQWGSEVSSFQRLKEWWYLGYKNVFCLDRCPQFRGAGIEVFHCSVARTCTMLELDK